MSKFNLKKLISAVAGSRRGATAIEYGLMAALIAGAIAVGVGALGAAVNGKFAEVTAAID